MSALYIKIHTVSQTGPRPTPTVSVTCPILVLGPPLLLV